MRIMSSTRDPVHTVRKPFHRTIGNCALQTHVIHTFLGCLGACEVPPLRIGYVAHKDGERLLMTAHGVKYSCKTIGIQ